MMEHEVEPIRGLPGLLPKGETILWQGGPDWWTLARAAFHVRGVSLYFAALAMLSLVMGSVFGTVALIISGVLCVGLLALIAWGVGRTTVYTLTNRRLVLRIGIALPKCINLPLSLVRAADLRPLRHGHGDLALAMEHKGRKLGYLLLWPHARPWKLRDPQPMLRALPDAQGVAALLADACAALAGRSESAPPIERAAPEATAPAQPVMVGAAA